MVERRALVQIGGVMQETPTGDTLYGGGGSGSTVSEAVTQASHGFVVGNVIYQASTGWSKAKSDSVETTGWGIVSAVADTSNFTVTTLGLVTLTTGQWDVITGGSGGLTADTAYFVSSATAGGLTAVEPAISNPMGVAISTTSLRVFPWRPSVLDDITAPIFFGYRSTTLAVAEATQTVYSLTNAILDSHGGWTGSGYQCQKTGWYWFTGFVAFSGNINNTCRGQLSLYDDTGAAPVVYSYSPNTHFTGNYSGGYLAASLIQLTSGSTYRPRLIIYGTTGSAGTTIASSPVSNISLQYARS